MISGSEVAFFSFNHSDIEKCKRSNLDSERKIVQLLKAPKSLLATILILNNAVNIAFVSAATFTVWHYVGSPKLTLETSAYLTITVTISLLLFGEVVPKIYSSKNNLRFARFMSGPLWVSGIILKPLSIFLIKMSSIIEKRVERKGHDITVEELNHALDLTSDDDGNDGEKDILKGVVNFGSLTVKQVMKSRLDIMAFDYEMDFHDLMDKVNKTGFSRVPVFKETIDKIEGILYVKDLLPHIDKEEGFGWQTLLRSAFYVPESKKIDSLLKDFQEKRVHMAIVVDEYGGTSGLITLEDLIEEIVGEINDEFDDEGIEYNKLDQNTYIFEAKISLNDFAKALEIDGSIFESVKGESESLAGLLLEIHSKFPRVGEKILFENFVFTVVSVDSKKIRKVRVFIKPKVLDDVS